LLHERHIGLIRRNQGVPRLVFSEEAHGSDSARRRRLYEVIERYRDRVGAIISEGRQAGAISEEVSPEGGSLLFLGLIQPIAILWHVSGGDFDVVSETQRCWGLFLRAIRPASIPAPDNKKELSHADQN
jgi:hypothetical protein